MSARATSDVFTRISTSVEGQYAGSMLLCESVNGSAVTCRDEEPMSLDDLRSRVCGGEAELPGRTAAWRHVAHHLREEPGAEGERRWTLITVWLLAPRLRGAMYWIARRTGAERADVGSALLQGLLEGVRTLDAASSVDIEQHLVDAAFAVGRRTGRRDPKESPVGEWDRAGAETATSLMTTAPAVVVRVDALTQALAQRAQGERLGALAYRLGLLPHVRRVRQNSRSKSRRPCRTSHRVTNDPTFLFEMREPAHETSS